MRIIGVDPGVTGGIALLVDGKLHGVIDMPVFDSEASAALIANHIQLAEPDLVVIEWVQPMPRNGSIASFSLGKNYGIVIGVCGALRHPLVKIRPNEWKKTMGLTGKDKKASLGLAIQLWPEHAEFFKRAKDDGRAEAALIARAQSYKLVAASNAE